MKGRLVKALAYVLASIGIVASGAASMGCVFLFLDEVEAPKNLL
jgi:cyclic lactone autoinducer peptide